MRYYMVEGIQGSGSVEPGYVMFSVAAIQGSHGGTQSTEPPLRSQSTAVCITGHVTTAFS